LLGLFNFHGDEVFKPVKVLSGGEKSRLILAKLLIDPPNFMLLDEPTTHLDLDGIKALTKAFQQYEGTVCFISHDLYFIKEIADCIIDVQNGTIRTYLGGLDYYLDKREGRMPGEAHHADAADPNKKNADKNVHRPQQTHEPKNKIDVLHNKHKEALKRITQIKNEIGRLEKEAKELEMESYVKSRQLSKQFDRPDQETLKEFGKRLKDIQKRQREIMTTIKELEEEKNRISR